MFALRMNLWVFVCILSPLMLLDGVCLNFESCLNGSSLCVYSFTTVAGQFDLIKAKHCLLESLILNLGSFLCVYSFTTDLIEAKHYLLEF